MAEIKICSKCGQSNRYKTGQCKPCHQAAMRRYFDRNPGKVRESKRNYKRENPEKVEKALLRRLAKKYNVLLTWQGCQQ